MPFVGGDEYVGPAHKHPKGVLVLRADFIRSYGLSGEAATFHPTALFRHS